MKTMFAEEIAAVTGGRLRNEGQAGPVRVSGVSTDTRTLAAGDVFFALPGETHDAHDHLSEAAEKGCALFVVSDAAKIPAGAGVPAIIVENTLRAYQDLAAWYRKEVDPVVAAVTGSVGKTTLKDMIACICAEVYHTAATEKNYNNQIGVAKTILSMPENTEVLILEMGMEHAGEIERSAEIARPDIAVITNAGISHRENFDSDGGILAAKMEVAAFFGPRDVLVINGDQQDVLAAAEADSAEKGYQLVSVRQNGEGDEDCEPAAYRVKGARYNEEGRLTFEIESWDDDVERFVLPILGAYGGLSTGLAAAAAARLGIGMSAAARSLRTFETAPHRMQPIQGSGVFIIDDTYNASPDSADSGLDFFETVDAKKKVVVLADMNELGAESETLHRRVGARAAESGADLIVAFGEKAREIAAGALREIPRGAKPEVFHFEEKAELLRFLLSQKQEGDAYYIKGSRSMKMEEVVGALLGEE
ncbi:MAG: UDP-N-acetylmuramoyl-tripeptide--D-alanyl-D-alanine ligase [Clostridiales Family XIII bacterium]|jgi:UDP-N-acetylmuramoyl-tripeptide--D-alanyl-D-alanine ligase|nr:UDP-N-acetylmuramoyl-tripeptide--D-alanyl-D-alanine ligase [Clostridiales Family XIII bacterium]